MAKPKHHITADELKAKGYHQQPDGSWSKANPALGGLEAREHTQQTGALESKAQTKLKSSIGRKARRVRHRPAEVVVTMVAHMPRYFDDDNLTGALKPVRDEIADWLGIDDADGRVRWEYGQVETQGAVGVVVKVESLTDQA